jgi:Tfp pilus assembly protein PilN
MAQQINLCTPILLTQKRYFSAQTMALSLAVFMVLGSVMAGVFVWGLKSSSAGYTQTMADQTREIESLNAAIARSKANTGPVDPALVQQLQDARKSVQQRTQLLAALQDGVLKPGEGHSDRLLLVARSIPAPVWVTQVVADSSSFEVSGFTLEPAALNTWVDKLAISPLMSGLRLSSVKVENTVAAQVKVPAAAAAAVPPGAGASLTRAVWSFSLVNTQPPAAPVAGAKP